MAKEKLQESKKFIAQILQLLMWFRRIIKKILQIK